MFPKSERVKCEKAWMFGLLIRPRLDAAPEPGNARLRKLTQFPDFYKPLTARRPRFF
jgi:hypothetical protein